jgi:hypothetical protein
MKTEPTAGIERADATESLIANSPDELWGVKTNAALDRLLAKKAVRDQRIRSLKHELGL